MYGWYGDMEPPEEMERESAESKRKRLEEERIKRVKERLNYDIGLLGYKRKVTERKLTEREQYDEMLRRGSA